MKNKFQVGDLLKRIKNKIEIQNKKKYKRLTIKNHHRGVVIRDEVFGEIIGTKNQFVVNKNQFILSKIDARLGSFGIVPFEADGAIITGNFWTYSVNPKLVEPEWFLEFTNSLSFLKLCIDSSKGNTNRKYLDEKIFLSHKLDIPELNVQKNIVKKINKLKNMLNEVDKNLNEKTRIVNKLYKKYLDNLILGKINNNLPKESNISFTELGKICTKTGSGSTPLGGKDSYLENGIPFLRSQNIHNEGLKLENVAYISKETHEKMSNTKVIPNDILLNITGGSIGRCSIVKNEFEEANINQHVSIIRLKNKKSVEYVHSVIKSDYFQNHIFDNQTGAGREGLPKKKMDKIKIPFPKDDNQQRIVKKLKNILKYLNIITLNLDNNKNLIQKIYSVYTKKIFNIYLS